MNLLIITKKVDENDQLLAFFIDWIARFAQKFEKVIVFCLAKGGFNLPDNVKVLSMGKDSGASKLKQLFTFYFLLFTLRKDYDAVFVHMNPIWVVLGGPWWRITRKKIFFWYTSGGVTVKLRLAEKFANIIFTASKESFRIPSKKVVVTGHGIDTDLFRPMTNDQRLTTGLRILSVGRIAPVKNYETLIRAVKILKDQNIEFSVTIIGEPALKKDQDYEKSLKLKARSLKLDDYFNFVGKVGYKDLPPYYQSHDLFVHLSKTGSLDKTLLEAMSCGMKVLSSSDAAKSFLPSELIFSENNPLDLAEKIQHVMGDDSDFQLREYVLKYHNLNLLIDKITSFIKRKHNDHS